MTEAFQIAEDLYKSAKKLRHPEGETVAPATGEGATEDDGGMDNED